MALGQVPLRPIVNLNPCLECVWYLNIVRLDRQVPRLLQSRPSVVRAIARGLCASRRSLVRATSTPTRADNLKRFGLLCTAEPSWLAEPSVAQLRDERHVVLEPSPFSPVRVCWLRPVETWLTSWSESSPPWLWWVSRRGVWRGGRRRRGPSGSGCRPCGRISAWCTRRAITAAAGHVVVEVLAAGAERLVACDDRAGALVAAADEHEHRFAAWGSNGMWRTSSQISSRRIRSRRLSSWSRRPWRGGVGEQGDPLGGDANRPPWPASGREVRLGDRPGTSPPRASEPKSAGRSAPRTRSRAFVVGCLSGGSGATTVSVSRSWDGAGLA